MKTIKPAVILSLFLIGFPLFSQSPLINIRIDPMDLPQGNLMLSDMIQSIEYIPLETTDECLIGDVWKFDITGNYIIVHCGKSQKTYLFDRKGKFISQIGRIGGGPGEYIQNTFNGVFIDESNKRIIIHANYDDRIMYYDLTGKYLDRLLEEENIGVILRYYNSWFLTCHPFSKGRVPYTYAIRTPDLKALSQSIKPVSYEMVDVDNPTATTGTPWPSIYIYNGLLHVKESTLNDTLYTIGQNHVFRPKYRINAGKYEVTVEARSQFWEWVKNGKNYVIHNSSFETNNNLLLSYSYQQKKYYAYYDKEFEKLFYCQSSNGIPNDYDGGFDFWPVRQDEKTLYAFYDAFQVEELLRTKKKITPKGSPQAIQAAKRILGKIDPEDNPVLVIVTLK